MSEPGPQWIADYIAANQQLARELVEARDELAEANRIIESVGEDVELHAGNEERLEAEVGRLRADLADARDRITEWVRTDAELQDRIAAVEYLISPMAQMGTTPYGDGGRYFREVDIRDALSAGGSGPAEGDSGE